MINGVRLSCGSLLLFELLNWAGVLSFSLTFSWLGLIITLLVAWGVLEVLNHYFRRHGGQLLQSWLFVLVFTGLGLDALGDILHWYQNLWWYDNLIHALGGLGAGLLIALVCWRLEKIYELRLPWGLFFAAALGIAMALGVVYELEEYLEDFFTGSQRLGDGFDTANDLLMNTMGSLLGIAAVLWRRKKKST